MSRKSKQCQHIYNAHQQCQWCHRMRIDIELDRLVRCVRRLSAEFKKYAEIPETDPPRGLQVSRMHFAGWAKQLQRAVPQQYKKSR